MSRLWLCLRLRGTANRKRQRSQHRRSTSASHTFASHRRRRSAASTDSLDLGSLVWRGEESAGKIEWKRKTDRVKETCKGKYFLPTDTKTKVRFKRIESGFKKSKEITARLLVHIGTLKLYSWFFNAFIFQCQFFFCFKFSLPTKRRPPSLGPTDISKSEQKAKRSQHLKPKIWCCDLSRKKSFCEFIVSIQWVNPSTCLGLDSRH